MKILVRNLATATTEEKLKSLFIEHGTIQSCNLILDKKTGKSKGFGFIEMPKAGEAKIAIKTLNGYKLAGNIIRVKKAEEKKVASESHHEEKKPVPPKKETETAFAAKKTNDSQEIKSNNNNSKNIYGTIKKSDS